MTYLPPGYFTIGGLVEMIGEIVDDVKSKKVTKEDIKNVFIENQTGRRKNIASQFSRLYWAAKRGGYLAESFRGDDLIVTLTDKVKLKKLEKEFARAAKLKSNKYILVSFDIPQTRTVVRNHLRSFLKRNGFKLIQKSVLIGKADVAVELMALLKEYGVDEWARIFYVSKIVF